MTDQIRPYQQQLINSIRHAWAAGAQNTLGVLPTGGGKTWIFSKIVADHGAPAVAIAHRQEIVAQISLSFAKHGIRHGLIAPKNVVKLINKLHMEELGRSFYHPSAPVKVAGVDTLIRRKDLNGWCDSVSLWVQDECFPAGTLVDGVPIENLKVGDFVTSFDEKKKRFEKKKIARLFKNPLPDYMTRVEVGHHVINATCNHPFYTKRGWIGAKNLTLNDEVLHYELHALRPSNFKSEGTPDVSTEKEQPHAQRKLPRENVEHPHRDRTPPKNSRRKWYRAAGFRSRARHTNRRRKWLPAFVQTRPRPLGAETGDRSGRGEPLRPEKTRTGPEKRNVSKWLRVDNVKVFKSGDFERNRESNTENYVYNIEVEDFHTYLVEGVVVHNCHHVLSGNKWGKAADLFRNARGLGVTATPVRADGKGLGRHADGLFDAMVEGPAMRELITGGYLSDYRVFAPPSDLDMSNVAVGANGDWTLPGTVKAVRKSRVVGDVVKHYKLIAPGKLGITFAVDVQTATDIAAQFNANGVPAEVVSAKTSDHDRVQILRRFRRRELLQLVNVDLFGEGFDLPAVEVVSMARPTQSFGLYCQQFGRALRVLLGKSHAIIIDHVGNVVRHGLPDRRRVWSLDRRERRARDADPDVIPVKACPNCTAVYERIYSSCPYCSHTPKPMARSGPEFVDGDLTELDAETLARMRGDVIDVAMTSPEYLAASGAGHLPHVAALGAANRFKEKQAAQQALRESIALWAGYQVAAGRPDSESYRRFYFMFGLDVLTAMALGRKDAEKLKLLIDKAVSML